MVNKQTVKKQQYKSDAKFKLSPLSAGVRLAITGVLAGSLSQNVLAELPVAAQNFVSSGVATQNINGHRMDINQSSNRAVLNWQSFNIGEKNHVNFNQPSSSAVALNRIGQKDPSRILGKLTANGQVHLINQNGFIFGKNAVIDVNSLIASTHDIADSVLERGLTQVFDENGDSAMDRMEIVLHDGYVLSSLDDLQSYLEDQGISYGALAEKINQTEGSVTFDASDDAALFQQLQSLSTELSDKGFNIDVDALKKEVVFKADSKGRLSRTPAQFKQLHEILVESGADITAGDGGNVILVAPKVTNRGDIKTEGVLGQIMLVASQDKVYLQQADSDDFNGILVEVDTGGEAGNFGTLLAKQGGVSMAGFAVNQHGRISATKSTSINGSIRLQAREGHTKNGDKLSGVSTTRANDLNDGLGTEAKVTFAENSVTELIAEVKFVIKSADQLKEGDIVVSRDALNIVDDIDSLNAGGQMDLLVNGAKIDEVLDSEVVEGDLIARDQQLLISAEADASVFDGQGKFNADNAVIVYVSDTATDGQDKSVSYMDVSAHSIEVKKGSHIKLQSGQLNMLATDNLVDPLQGNQGKLLIEEGSRIDVSGVDQVQVKMERHSGSVDARSSYVLRDSPNQKDGILFGEKSIKVDMREETSIIDDDGPKNRIQRSVYERMGAGGEINLTSSGEIIVEQGALIDISGGSVDYQTGVITTTQLVNQAGQQFDIAEADANDTFIKLFEQDSQVQGYQEGQDAGSLNIKTAELSWQGDLKSETVDGRLQRTEAQRAKGGNVSINLSEGFESTQGFQFNQNNALSRLAMSGIQRFILDTLGEVKINADARLQLADNAEFTIRAGHIQHAGHIYSAGGDITLAGQLNLAKQADGEVIMADGSLIDVSGRWINDRYTAMRGQFPSEAITKDAGSVQLISESNLRMADNTVIRADAGAHYSDSRKLQAGKAGAISLLAGTAYNPENNQSSIIEDSNAYVDLAGQISAFGLEGSDGQAENGTLNINSRHFVLGNQSYTDDGQKINYLSGNDSIFSRFSKVSLTAVDGDIAIQSSANIQLAQQNQRLLANATYLGSQRSLQGLTQSVVLDKALRTGGHLDLTALGDITMAAGSAIRGENESRISLTADRNMYLDGLISAPAGEIALRINAGIKLDYDPAKALWLGNHARLNVAGAVELDPLSQILSGQVLAGGHISLQADRGYIVVERGAELDVSGTSAVLDIPLNSLSFSQGVERKTVGSDAGSVRLWAAGGMALEGQFNTQGGTASNRDAALLLELNRGNRALDAQSRGFPDSPLVFHLSQLNNAGVSGQYRFGDSLQIPLEQQSTIAAADLTQAGWDYLSIRSPDNIVLDGDLQLRSGIALKLDAAKISGGNPGTANLSAQYLALGSERYKSVNGTPQTGNAILNVQTDWLELYGAVMLDNFKQINLRSENDIRTVGLLLSERDFRGELVTAADSLNLTAKQIYPSTLSEYSFSVLNNPQGTINIAGLANDLAKPLSAAGKLNFKAAHINQGGRVLAPMGQISFESDSLNFAAGSVTSVSGDGLLVPFGVMQIGRDWLYPISPFENLVIDAPVDKKIRIQSKDVVQHASAELDLSGGGDIFAYQFEPGIGGSFDFMDANSEAYQNSFAVIPGLGSAYSPLDHFQTLDQHFSEIKDTAFKPGESVVIQGGGSLAAGEYAKLPAHYALLPGAYLLTPMENSQDSSGISRTLDGREIVSAYQSVAGAGKQQARSSAYMLENGDQIRKRAKYTTFTGDTFFSAKAEQSGLKNLCCLLMPVYCRFWRKAV